jgi:hypothetical protein
MLIFRSFEVIIGGKNHLFKREGVGDVLIVSVIVIKG